MMRTITGTIRKQVVFMGLLLLPVIVGAAVQMAVRGPRGPTLQQRIAAVLVSWGRFPCDLTLPVPSRGDQPPADSAAVGGQ